MKGEYKRDTKRRDNVAEIVDRSGRDCGNMFKDDDDGGILPFWAGASYSLTLTLSFLML